MSRTDEKDLPPPEGDSPGGDAATACLIVGLGNCLMRDDGIGVHAARRLMEARPPGATVIEVGTDVFGAISWLEGARWVLAIDAMDAGGAPGAIYSCRAADIAGPECPKSLHELGLVAVLEFIPEHLRPEVLILGVQPEVIDYGLELSPALERALPEVVLAAREMVRSRAPETTERR
jgi:hydrogenase maturation protease